MYHNQTTALQDNMAYPETNTEVVLVPCQGLLCAAMGLSARELRHFSVTAFPASVNGPSLLTGKKTDAANAASVGKQMSDTFNSL